MDASITSSTSPLAITRSPAKNSGLARDDEGCEVSEEEKQDLNSTTTTSLMSSQSQPIANETKRTTIDCLPLELLSNIVSYNIDYLATTATFPNHASRQRFNHRPPTFVLASNRLTEAFAFVYFPGRSVNCDVEVEEQSNGALKAFATPGKMFNHAVYQAYVPRVELEIQVERLCEIPVAVRKCKDLLRRFMRVVTVKLTLNIGGWNAWCVARLRGGKTMRKAARERKKRRVQLEAQAVWMVWAVAAEQGRRIDIEVRMV